MDQCVYGRRTCGQRNALVLLNCGERKSTSFRALNSDARLQRLTDGYGGFCVQVGGLSALNLPQRFGMEGLGQYALRKASQSSRSFVSWAMSVMEKETCTN
jgi:hypothetical protein